LFIAHLIIKSIAKPNNGSFGAKLKSVISSAFSILPLYLPAIVIVFSFLAWHYYKTGWIGYHKNMPWYPLFEIVDFKGAIRNVFILGWRLNDFGHLFVWLAGILCVWHFVKKRPLLNDTFRNLAILYICLLLALGQAVVLHKGLAGHRYLLPLYLLFSLIVSYYVFHYVTSCKTKKVFFAALLIGLLSGNCWVYPDKIAKGWDSTLAYLPYHPLRTKMIQYMHDEKISIAETGSPFPNHGQFRYLDLSNSHESFAILDLKTNQYVFYSNVYNDFTDEELSELKNRWTIVKEYRSMQVRVTLYKRP